MKQKITNTSHQREGCHQKARHNDISKGFMINTHSWNFSNEQAGKGLEKYQEWVSIMKSSDKWENEKCEDKQTQAFDD